MNFSIERFWSQRLASVTPAPNAAVLRGWTTQVQKNLSFIEAELTLRPDHSDLSAPIWLIAAPGAVGKSTLAKEICANSGATYLDLAKADTVAGNYLTGGLFKNSLLFQWQQNTMAVIIDALDEARLRVTQISFEDFLSDVLTLSRGRSLPTILFGRVGIVDETWLILNEHAVASPIFDINFFDESRSRSFVMAVLDRLSGESRYSDLAKSLTSYRQVYEQASTKFIDSLARKSASDGVRFSGYAPVLEAVATELAAVLNPTKLTEDVDEKITKQVLRKLAESILDREADKVRSQLESLSTHSKAALYAPDEQLDRLASLVLGTPAPPLPSSLSQQDLSAYDNALVTLLPQHPFLDGTGKSPSGAVFAGMINAHALFSKCVETKAAAELHAGEGPHTPNPFLVDFYLDEIGIDQDGLSLVPPEHVVILYESVRARAAAGNVLSLSIESDERDGVADVEILSSNVESQLADRPLEFRTSQAGELRFGRQVNGVAVDAPDLDVVIGSGNPVELIAPVYLNIGRLTLRCSELSVQRGESSITSGDTIITIEAKELCRSDVLSVPLVRKGAQLAVSWPGDKAYPWTTFASLPSGVEEHNLDEKLLSIRRLILAFRSHSRGRLARFEGKIEHRRITKGAVGEAVRSRMMQDGILEHEGNMYFLNPSKLGEVVGTSYQELRFKQFNQKMRQYAASIVA